MCTMCVLSAQEGQKRASDSLQLQLQTAVSHHMGAEPGSSMDLNCLAISPAPWTLLDLYFGWKLWAVVGGEEESWLDLPLWFSLPQCSEFICKWGGREIWVQNRNNQESGNSFLAGVYTKFSFAIVKTSAGDSFPVHSREAEPCYFLFCFPSYQKASRLLERLPDSWGKHWKF